MPWRKKGLKVLSPRLYEELQEWKRDNLIDFSDATLMDQMLADILRRIRKELLA